MHQQQSPRFTSPPSSPALSSPTPSRHRWNGSSPASAAASASVSLSHHSTRASPAPNRLLVATSRSPQQLLRETVNHRVSRVGTSSGKFRRPRSNSVSVELTNVAQHDHSPWFDTPCKFEVVQDELEIAGFQIYAVEKWIVERTRNVTLLTVYTGDAKDKVAVTVLAPDSTLEPHQVQAQWDRLLHDLRREGARPRETEHGTILVTSLANFRSDFTIVPIPDGKFLDHREQLYANINLLRMGCSGRTALTLQPSSDSTRDRFISLYNFRDSGKSSQAFVTTVLEFVKIIQAALSLFNMFPSSIEEQNGLLCDRTVEGLQKWVTEIGESYLGIEPMERVCDPSTIAALLSLVLVVRNKLNAIGLSTLVPKDPFLHPYLLMHALHVFGYARNPANAHLSPPAAASSHSITLPTAHTTFLDIPLLKRIDAAYDKARQSESYKVHRVLLNKLDDLTSATTSAISTGNIASSSNKDGGGGGGAFNMDCVETVVDLGVFVRKVAGAKDMAGSVRGVWAGRAEQVARRRREMMCPGPEDGEGAQGQGRERARSREKEREENRSGDARSTDDEGDLSGGLLWSNKVHRKIESWAGMELRRTRPKKGSIDTTNIKSGFLSVPGEPASPGSSERNSPIPPSAATTSSLLLPSNSQHSRSRSQAHTPQSPNLSSASIPLNLSLSLNLESASTQRRLEQFERTRPTMLYPPRVSSWSDALMAADSVVGDEDPGTATARRREFRVADWVGTEERGEWEKGRGEGMFERRVGSCLNAWDLEEGERRRARGWFVGRLKRHYSSDDVSAMREEDSLSVEQMEIDTELCGQLIIARKRELHIKVLTATLELVHTSLTSSNTLFKHDYESHSNAMRDVLARADVGEEIEEVRMKADMLNGETNALEYEYDTRRYDADAVWLQAKAPRRRVFAIREQVFGTGRKYSMRSASDSSPSSPSGPGTSPTASNASFMGGRRRARFDRVQKTVGGRERMVDWLGRTESEAEEEEGLPEMLPEPGDEDDVSVVGEKDVMGQGSGVARSRLAPGPGMGMGIVGQARSGHAWFLEFFARWGRNLGVGVGRGRGAGEAGGDTSSKMLGDGSEGTSMSRPGNGPITPMTPRRMGQVLPPSVSPGPRLDKSLSDEDAETFQDAKSSLNA